MSGYVHSLLGATEKVIVRERQHWFMWLPRLLLTLLIVAVLTTTSIFASVQWKKELGDLPLLLLVFNIIPIWSFVRVFLAWLTEEYIVTTRRIIQTEGIINKSVIDSSLEKINDVTMTQTVIGRIMDFGDLEILTGSELGINKLHRIQSPVRFKIAMVNAKEALRSIGDMENGTSGRSTGGKLDISTSLSDLETLRQRGLITETEYQEKRAKLMGLL